MIRREKSFHLFIQRSGSLQIFPERLLQNHLSSPRSIHLLQPLYNDREKPGSNCKVKHMVLRPVFTIKSIQFPIRFFFCEIHAVIENPFRYFFIYLFPEGKSREFFHPVPGQFPISTAGIIPPAYHHNLRIKGIASRHFHVVQGRDQLPEGQIPCPSEYGKCIFFTHCLTSNRGGRFLPCHYVHRYGPRSSPSGPGSDLPPPAFPGMHPGKLRPGSWREPGFHL